MSLAFTPPGPVAARFMASLAPVEIIAGPLGSGKSTTCLFKLLAVALAQPVVNGVRRARMCVLRNTAAQLRDTIKPVIDSWFVEAPEQPLGSWALTEMKFRLKMQLPDETILDMEFWCMAVDEPKDVRRLLSIEFTAAWVEEGREINADVFAGLQGRVGRYPAVVNGGVAFPIVIVSTNYPNVGSYWHGVMLAPPAGWEVFEQPAAILDDLSLNPLRENPNLPDDYYDRLISGKTEEWLNVFLKCKFGTDMAGLPVYRSSFNRQMHVAADKFEPLRHQSYPLVVGMDNGLTAAAAILQQDVRGRLRVLGEAFVPEGTTMGVERFLDTLLIPKLRNEYYGCRIIFSLDPACFQRQQRDETTIADAVKARTYTVERAVTNYTEQRIGAVEQALVRQIDGKGYFQINPDCTHLINAFEWGYRYAQHRDGTPNSETDPVKNIFSHISDGCQYGVLHWHAPMRELRTQQRKVKASPYHWGNLQ